MNILLFIKRKLKGLARLGWREHMLLLEATICLAIARVWLLVTPFRSIAGKLGKVSAPDSGMDIDPAAKTAKNEAIAKAISVAVERGSKNVPFRSVCIQQAIAGKLMLIRRGIPSVMHFGVEKGVEPGEPILAHAWLDFAEVKVTGYPMSPQMKEIARFV